MDMAIDKARGDIATSQIDFPIAPIVSYARNRFLVDRDIAIMNLSRKNVNDFTILQNQIRRALAPRDFDKVLKILQTARRPH